MQSGDRDRNRARHGTAGPAGALFEGRVSGDRRDRRNQGGLGSVAVLNTTTSGILTTPPPSRVSRALTSGSKTPLAGWTPRGITRESRTNSSLPRPRHRAVGQIVSPRSTSDFRSAEFLHGTRFKHQSPALWRSSKLSLEGSVPGRMGVGDSI